ncbi:MAG TPA: hypothetical protein VN809_06740, partial [Telmatospirillum sp.]|nr:hypothetical protein [Telmatospirillum sp.]
ITYIHTPLYYTGLIFIVRTNDEIVDIKSFDDIRRLGTDGRILSIGGTAEVAQLNGVGGLLVDDSPKSGEMNLQMLVRKRGRLAYLTDLEAAILIPKKNLTNDVRILPTVFSREARYLGISKQVPAETVERLRTDLAILENNGTLAKIIKDYNKMLPGDK